MGAMRTQTNQVKFQVLFVCFLHAICFDLSVKGISVSKNSQIQTNP